MGKNKNRQKNVEAEFDATNEVNLPAEQDDSETTEVQTKEEKEMKPKKVRRNVLQFVGDGIKAAGDAVADFGDKHPVAATVGKVAGGLAIAGGAAVGIIAAVRHNGDDVVDAEDFEETDLDDEFVDADVEDDFDDEEDSTSEEAAEEETTEESETV